MKCKRALETMLETMNRREQNRVHMANQRALEIPSDTIYRQEQNRTRTAKKRSTSIPVDNAICTFLLKAKEGPDYVCRLDFLKDDVVYTSPRLLFQTAERLAPQCFH